MNSTNPNFKQWLKSEVDKIKQDEEQAKREYEKAAKDFCIDNLSAFDK